MKGATLFSFYMIVGVIVFGALYIGILDAIDEVMDKCFLLCDNK